MDKNIMNMWYQHNLMWRQSMLRAAVMQMAAAKEQEKVSQTVEPTEPEPTAEPEQTGEPTEPEQTVEPKVEPTEHEPTEEPEVTVE